ncbi:hypothetical protein E7Z59_07230 [Robertkochia marina]|uniref:Uncharacterized protein n=1 Tax=Robertkochia marina TaxID=1227945 RepID=A0A4V3UY29_9FLAO|nr:hypothetical protein [Robertkochia marina]THD67446.1 hypothetical protein E7Z59_07230 [Robertkochia marina]TRZ44684.1 hypothetical protein D3A96_08720 [Robertkochia marina]
MDLNKEHKEDGFRIPENYFEGLEEKLRDRAALQDHIPKQEGFLIPEGYFENFEAELRNKISPGPGKVRHLSYLKRGLGVAATILGLFFLSTIFLNTEGDFSFDQVSTSDIEWLMEQGALEVPEIFLMEQAENMNLNDITMYTEPIKTSTLEEYLLEEMDVYEVLDESQN